MNPEWALVSEVVAAAVSVFVLAAAVMIVIVPVRGRLVCAAE